MSISFYIKIIKPELAGMVLSCQASWSNRCRPDSPVLLHLYFADV